MNINDTRDAGNFLWGLYIGSILGVVIVATILAIFAEPKPVIVAISGESDTIVITGQGDLSRAVEQITVEESVRLSIKGIIIEEGIKSVSNSDFFFQFPNLQYVCIPRDFDINEECFPDNIIVLFSNNHP